MKALLLLFLSLILVTCAQINPLTGGTQDEFAPTIDSAKSYPYNGETSFQRQEVKLKFNEYITLVKPNDNIIITPRPKINPTISAHNKTLTILFNEPLLDNTTYTISFNNAIADITEKNDSVFQYVFSTGTFIDSLSIQGQVTDAFTNLGAAQFLVALYPMENSVQFDSIPYLTKPTYITQTDKNGFFQLNYLHYGMYYVFAIDDKNKNMQLDAGEALAFLPEKSILVNDQKIEVSLKSFLPKSNKVKQERVTFSAPGRLEFIFSNPPEIFQINSSLPILKEETGQGDSLVFWLTEKPMPRMEFFTTLNEEKDTIRPVYKTSTQNKITYSTNLKEGKLLPEEKLKITFTEPLRPEVVTSSSIHVMTQDSVELDVVWEIENLRSIQLTEIYPQPLILQIDSAAVNTIFDNTNLTSIQVNFENHPASFYGSLRINTDSVFTQPVLIYLINSAGIVTDTAVYSKQIRFENVVPGDYQLRLVIDSDQNGVWTSGSLTEGTIPEKVMYFNEPIAIKSKWMKEIDWTFKTSKD